MRRFSWILGAVLSLLPVQEVAAQEATGTDNDDLPFEAQIQPCWSTPAGANTPAVITFKLKPDGNLDGTPVIKSRGKGALNEAFARSALRAIMKCSPYRVGNKLEYETTFIPDPTGAQPETAEMPRQVPAADLQDGDPRTRIIDFGDVKIGFKVPEGFCAIDPKRGGYHRKLWQALAPPPERKSELKSLDIDCESLKKAEAGHNIRPKYGFTVTRFLEGKRPVPANLNDFLDEVEKDKEPLTPRYWEYPPVAGSPFLGRDDRAIYAAQRVLEDGKMVMSGVSAFTLAGGMPILLNHFAVEGPDLAREREARIAEIVAGMRVGKED
ncbi:energy transducer TonB [Rhizobium terrae]|uniref:hypothetical protein n=1 Tax=Rhizobium terrae TaxID=2171756 RepID=UPI000E3E831D|nr:hypothetical protein [Rhizobium terrae]